MHPANDKTCAVAVTPTVRGDWIATVAKAHKGANERTQEWRCAGCNAFRITDGTLPAPCYYCNHRGSFDD